MANRQTMGNDWGGRRKINPDDCPKVTGETVRTKAAMLNVFVRRGDFIGINFHPSDRGIWWYLENGKWLILGATNYVAFSNLTFMERKNE